MPHPASACTVSVKIPGRCAVAPVRLQITASTSVIITGLTRRRHPSRSESPLSTSTPTVHSAISTPTLCTSSTPRLSGPQIAAMIGSGR